jgi:signal transduction histidine kinase
VLYIALLLVSTHEDADVYILRPIYLGITGYLLVYLGQQRVDVEERMRALEIAEQRHRIARDLHDGYAQALAGINLRLETAREQLGAGAADQVLTDLTQLQRSIQREYDDLREYVRSLAGVESTPGRVSPPATTQLGDASTSPTGGGHDHCPQHRPRGPEQHLSATPTRAAESTSSRTSARCA